MGVRVIKKEKQKQYTFLYDNRSRNQEKKSSLDYVRVDAQLAQRRWETAFSMEIT